MALRVWMPLLGNLNNQGLIDNSISASGVTFDTSGKIGQCASFAGSNARIAFTGDTNVDCTHLSISCWAYITEVNSNGQYICCLNNTGGASDSTIAFYVNVSGSLQLYGGSGTVAISVPTTDYSLNTWMHFVGVIDGNRVTLYINGQLYSSVTGATPITRTHFVIGARCTDAANTSYNYYYKGKLNDFRLYDHSLSAAEAKELSQGLILHYKLDDITNGIQDSSGYGHNGTINGTLTLSNNTPRYSACAVFNGTDTRIQVPNLIPDAITVSFWMKRNANTGTRQFMYTAWNGVTCELQTNGTPTFAVYRSNYPTITGTAITTDSGWVHYCGTFDIINGLKLYQNGVLESSNNTLTAISWGITQNYIGYYNTYYNGLMSDFRIYCTALSADDIKQLYEVSAKVDNLGNWHTFEFIEDTDPKISKTGQTKVQNFMEYNALIPTTGTSMSYKPGNNATNQCTTAIQIDLSQFGNSGVDLQLQLDVDVAWSNFAYVTPPSDGTARTYFQGANRRIDTNAFAWEGSNYFTGTQFKPYIDANSTGSTHISKKITIPASWLNTYNGSCFQFRTDYSDGNGTIGFSNLKITPFRDANAKARIYSKRITANNLIER